MSIFNSEKVIKEHISDTDLRAYFVGFDFKVFRYDPLIDCILNALVDFSFGYHSGILEESYNRTKLIEAAKSIYGISAKDGDMVFKLAMDKYVTEDSEYEDDIEDKYLKRGEFGEIILHVILRDFIKTTPLISKIHFKDSDGITVHGFDSVHIGNSIQNSDEKSLYLGESKLYKSGEGGVKALVKDIEDHFKNDFIKREFILIGKKNYFLDANSYFDLNTKDKYEKFLLEKDYWFSELDKVSTGEKKMQDLFKSITIPLLCTYTSKVFEDHDDDDKDKFKKDYEEEINNLKILFNEEINKIKEKYKDSGDPISTNLNIVLMLFPVPSKKELIKKLHTKLYNQQKS